MKTSLFLQSTCRCAKATALGLVAFISIAGAAEMRDWTNLKGQRIKAELLAVDAENVRLRMDTGRDVTIPRKTLSAADQKYLTEYGGASEVAADPKAKVGMPAKTMKFDSKTINKRDEKLEFKDVSLEFDVVESEHFIVATSGSVRGKDTAELAERLWAGFNFQHPGFSDKWGEDKRVIILVGDESEWGLLGDYEVARIQAQTRNENAANDAANTARTWHEVSASGCGVPGDMQELFGAKSGANCFKAYDKRTWKRGVWNPFPTHVLARTVLQEMMGGAGGGVGAQGHFAITRGHAYFKEIQLTGETVTQMVDADVYESDELTKAGGFDDGKKWARTLRDLVKKGKVTPDIEALWRLKGPSDLTPELTVMMYGFARYMQSTPTRMAKFSELMERVDTSRQIPVPIEAAKIFGFETVSELQDDWTEYLKSTAFK